MVALEWKLTKTVTAERDLHCQGVWWKEFGRLSQEDSTCSLLTSRLTVTQEGVQIAQHWHRMEERSNHTTTNVENELISIVSQELANVSK